MSHDAWITVIVLGLAIITAATVVLVVHVALDGVSEVRRSDVLRALATVITEIGDAIRPGTLFENRPSGRPVRDLTPSGDEQADLD